MSCSALWNVGANWEAEHPVERLGGRHQPLQLLQPSRAQPAAAIDEAVAFERVIQLRDAAVESSAIAEQRTAPGRDVVTVAFIRQTASLELSDLVAKVTELGREVGGAQRVRHGQLVPLQH